MRRLIVHRQRALACFAMTYYCLPGHVRPLIDGAETGAVPALCREHGVPLRSGESAAVEIGEEPFEFFAVACLDGRNLVMDTCTIPAGTEDVRYTIVTDFDGYKRLQVRLEADE
jgi:hypothetical protein